MSRGRWIGALFSVTLALAGCASHATIGSVLPPSGGAPLQVAAEVDENLPVAARADYDRVVARVSGMVSDAELQRSVEARGLALQNVNWEDTGRAEGSALGPNISDLTLQVRRRTDSGELVSTLMPVIRFPNFTDRTGDINSNMFFVRTGNEQKGGDIHSVKLTDLLRNIREYASVPSSLGGDGNLLSPRDTHFLVSAQAVFLPIPKQGKATFNPVIFNYQSAPESPAVLTILVTRQGTSVKVIENRPDEASGAVGAGQELYFNDGGSRSSFTAERKSDVASRIQAQGGPKSADDKSAMARGADVLFLIQVPLKHKNLGMLGGMPEMEMDSAGAEPSPPPPSAAAPSPVQMDKSDVEQAVLGHGQALGPFAEGFGSTLVRDEDFPIRVTVQFYKATSNGVVDEKDLDMVAKSIGNVYEHADFVGSLVVPEGDRARPTAWQKMPNQWFPW
jgi:hypothetical protein